MDFLYTLLSLIAFSFLGIFLVFCFILWSTILGKSIGDPDYAPVKGTVFNQLLYFNTLHDYQAQVAKTNPTFRLLAPDQSELYTADPRNVEHILKTNFDKYSKDSKSRNVAQSIPAKKKRDHGEKEQGKNGSNDADNYSMFSSRTLASEKDIEELGMLKEQVEELHRKLLEKDELLKSKENTRDQMNVFNAKLDELKHQASEKES